MKKIIILFSILTIASTIFADTHIPGGNVNGVWTIDGSPYIIDGHISIQTDDTLIIEPGIQVIFSGNYKFIVQGKLLAEGTAIDTISFTAQDTTIGWHSLKFHDTNTNGQDSSKVVYCKLEYGNKGAIFCQNSSDILIENCLISKNTANNDGGAILCHYNSSPKIISVSIIQNIATHNGGGICCEFFSNPTLTNIIISENSANRGGGIHCYNSSPILTNVIICDNIANFYGGGCSYVGSSCPILIDVTISENSAYLYGGGIWCVDNSSPSLVNSILWNDTPQEIYIYSGSVTATYSDIQGGWAGVGNIDADPLFTDPQNGDFHLTWANFPIQDSTMSPCIDAGDPSSPYDPDNTIADMGAYYFDQSEGIIYGDVDGDGSVFAFDAALTLQYSAGLIELEDWQLVAADVDGDGQVIAFDAALILQYSAGLIDEFPVEGK